MIMRKGKWAIVAMSLTLGTAASAFYLRGENLAARLQIEAPVDLGQVKRGAVVDYSVSLTNTSASSLHLTPRRTSCGLIAPLSQIAGLTIEPGQTVAIALHLDTTTGREGTSQAELEFDGLSPSSKRITISSRIQINSEFAVSSGVFVLGAAGSAESIEIKAADPLLAVPTDVVATDKRIRVGLERVSEGLFRITATRMTADSSWDLGSVVVLTSSDKMPAIRVPVRSRDFISN